MKKRDPASSGTREEKIDSEREKIFCKNHKLQRGFICTLIYFVKCITLVYFVLLLEQVTYSCIRIAGDGPVDVKRGAGLTLQTKNYKVKPVRSSRRTRKVKPMDSSEAEIESDTDCDS